MSPAGGGDPWLTFSDHSAGTCMWERDFTEGSWGRGWGTGIGGGCSSPLSSTLSPTRPGSSALALDPGPSQKRESAARSLHPESFLSSVSVSWTEAHLPPPRGV